MVWAGRDLKDHLAPNEHFSSFGHCLELQFWVSQSSLEALLLRFIFSPDSREVSELWFKTAANLRGGDTLPHCDLSFSIEMNSPACCKLHVWFRFRTSSNYVCIQQEFQALPRALNMSTLKAHILQQMPKAIKPFCASLDPLGRLMALIYDLIQFINSNRQAGATQPLQTGS